MIVLFAFFEACLALQPSQLDLLEIIFWLRKFVWTTRIGKKMLGGGMSPARQLWPMFFYRSTAKEVIAGGY